MTIGQSRSLARLGVPSALLLGVTMLLPVLHIAHATGLRNVLAAFITVWTFVVLYRHQERPPLIAAMIPWLAVTAASSLWSADAETTLKSVLTDVIMPMGACFAAYLASRQPAGFRNLCTASTLGVVILGALTLLAFALGAIRSLEFEARPGLLFYYPGPGVASTLAVYTLPMALLMATDEERSVSYAGYVSLASILVVGLGSMNRMYWVALVAALFAFYFWQWPRLRAGRRRVLIAAMLVCTGAATGMVLYLTEARKVGDLAEDTRLLAWREWGAVAADAPMLGYGFGKKIVREIGGEKLSTQLIERHPYLRSHGHNLFLVVVLQVGVVGLAIFGALLWVLAMEAYRARDPARIRESGALAALLVAMVVKNLSDDFMDHAVVLAFWAYAGMFLGRLKPQTKITG